MKSDLLHHLGPAFLGSRLKRLGERMQAGATRVTAAAGLPMQPSHMPILAALDDQELTIGDIVTTVGTSQPGITRAVSQLVEMGLVQSKPGEDQRKRAISLTPAGKAAWARTQLHVLPQLDVAVRTLLGDQTDTFIRQISDAEKALAATPLDTLAAQTRPEILKIHEYSDALASHFRDINAEWINAMFHLEPTDADVLDHPREKIIDPGGVILFVEAKGLGIVGTCALQKTGANAYELTKMGVREAARGLKAGEFLLAAIIERAKSLHADPLYLLTNKRCEAAVHLYEKLGFEHDAEIMTRYGARYERCDVAMRHIPAPSQPHRQLGSEAKTDNYHNG